MRLTYTQGLISFSSYAGISQIYQWVYSLFACWRNFSKYFIICRLFFKINFFKKLFQEHYQSVKTVWIQIRPDILSGLIWFQTVCKNYQQMTKVSTWRQRDKFDSAHPNSYFLSINFMSIQCCLDNIVTLTFPVVIFSPTVDTIVATSCPLTLAFSVA